MTSAGWFLLGVITGMTTIAVMTLTRREAPTRPEPMRRTYTLQEILKELGGQA